jgi:hypothetical protein
VLEQQPVTGDTYVNRTLPTIRQASRFRVVIGRPNRGLGIALIHICIVASQRTLPRVLACGQARTSNSTTEGFIVRRIRFLLVLSLPDPFPWSTVLDLWACAPRHFPRLSFRPKTTLPSPRQFRQASSLARSFLPWAECFFTKTYSHCETILLKSTGGIVDAYL